MTNSETLQHNQVPAKHTQTVMAELVPSLVCQMDEIT